MELRESRPVRSDTEHGLLIAFGQFAQQHGLVSRLMQVPIDQKTRTFTPQTKLLELLVGTLAGIEYLRDLNDGPHPIAKDPLVAEAWGKPPGRTTAASVAPWTSATPKPSVLHNK